MAKDFVFDLNGISPDELATLRKLLIVATSPGSPLGDGGSLWLVALLSRVVKRWPFKGSPDDMVAYGKLRSKDIFRLLKALVPQVVQALNGGTT